MEKISVSKFKATCLEIFERVSKTGEEYIITKRGVSIAKVVPTLPESSEAESRFGCMSEKAKEIDDILKPLSSEDEWEVFN